MSKQEEEAQQEIFRILNDIYSDQYITDAEFRYKTVQAHRDLISQYGNIVVDDYFNRFMKIESMLNG